MEVDRRRHKMQIQVFIWVLAILCELELKFVYRAPSQSRGETEDHHGCCLYFGH